MSLTTTPPTETGGPGAERPVVRQGAEAEHDPVRSSILEFYSPSSALMVAPALPGARQTLYLIWSMAMIMIAIFVFVQDDRIVSGTGKIVSLTPQVVVAPLNTSIIKTIAVAEGDIVRKGQLLAQLDPTVPAASDVQAREQTDRYQTEIDRLQAELHNVAYHPRQLTPGAVVQEGIFAQRSGAREAQQRFYQGQIDAQRALMAEADANIRQYAKETGVVGDIEKLRETLESDQVGSRLDTLAAVQSRLDFERQVLISIQQFNNARQTVASLQGQLDNYNQQWFADASQTYTDDSVQLAQYRAQLEQAALNYKLVDLRAEEDSIVLNIAPYSVGSVIQSGVTFFQLVPVNAPLEVDVQLTGDVSGFVTVGQPASIKFSTFPYERFGLGYGTVRLISADSYLSSASAMNMSSGPSASSTSPGATGSSGTVADSVFTGMSATSPFYYDARVTLDRLKLKSVPKEFRVVPGMPVQADIKVGKRTIFQYLIERVAPVFTEGMREPS